MKQQQDTTKFFGDNAAMAYAWQLIEDCGANVFLTGKAGSGKTTFLRHLRAHSHKNVVVLAPTGIAAVNAGGVTIHSFFQLPLQPFVPDAAAPRRHERMSAAKLRLLRGMDLLVIDEISMVRADLLDAIDESLRRHRRSSQPFGGVQLLLIGDLQQLAPVARDDSRDILRKYYDTEYFFGSLALQRIKYHTVELEHIYRQSDLRFLQLLNHVRDNTAGPEVLAALNKRVRRGFRPPTSEGYIRLVTHNTQAKAINDAELAVLSGRDLCFNAKVKGDFPDAAYPADQSLVLRVGAQVMFLRNDTQGRYCNGTIGHVAGMEGDNVVVMIAGDTSEPVVVEPAEWKNTKYELDDEGHVKETVAGVFSQVPLRLAWAVTVHKSQGLTFDRAIIDVSRSFAHGQTYVALSRCTSLDGLVLNAPLTPNSIINDPAVTEYCRQHRPQPCTSAQMCAMRNDYFVHTLGTVFNLTALNDDVRRLAREVSELVRLREMGFSAAYEEQLQLLRALTETADKFLNSARNAAHAHTAAGSDMCTDDAFALRIHNGAVYYGEKLSGLKQIIAETPANSASMRERLKTASETLCMFLMTMQTVAAEKSYTPETLTEARLGALTRYGRVEAKPKKTSQKARKPQKATVNIEGLDDPANVHLLEALKEWRTAVKDTEKVPPYVVAHDKALIAIANAAPMTLAELSSLPGWSSKKVQKYGEAIVSIVAQFEQATDD